MNCEANNYPIITVYVTPCTHPTRYVPEWQTTFIKDLYALDLLPLVDSKESVDRAALVRECGIVFYDNLTAVPCCAYDVKRRPLAAMLYRQALSGAEQLEIATWFMQALGLDHHHKYYQLDVVEQLRRAGCFSARPVDARPVIQSEFLGFNVICE